MPIAKKEEPYPMKKIPLILFVVVLFFAVLECPPYPTRVAWFFDFGGGFLAPHFVDGTPYAWARRDGDSAPTAAPPIADAGPDRVVLHVVTLDASRSNDSGGTIDSYEWVLQYRGDSGYDRKAEGDSPTVSDLQPGYYDVTLTVRDNDGLTDTDTMLLAVAGPWQQGSCVVTPDARVVQRGGTLGFQATIANNSDEIQAFHFATDVIKPSGKRYPPSGYLLGPWWVVIKPHESASIHKSHTIPRYARPGTYTYHGYVKKPGGGVCHECQFEFQITAPPEETSPGD
jgi:hypothetical protein